MPLALWRILLSIFLVSALGMTLSACGKRGRLDTPSGQRDVLWNQYPKQDLPPEAPATEQTPTPAPPQAPAQQTPVPNPMYQ